MLALSLAQLLSRATEQLLLMSIMPGKLKEFCWADNAMEPAAVCWWVWASMRRSGMFSMPRDGPWWDSWLGWDE
jgi:hypothetical protein